jgi:hypothetical protein
MLLSLAPIAAVLALDESEGDVLGSQKGILTCMPERESPHGLDPLHPTSPVNDHAFWIPNSFASPDLDAVIVMSRTQPSYAMYAQSAARQAAGIPQSPTSEFSDEASSDNDSIVLTASPQFEKRLLEAAPDLPSQQPLKPFSVLGDFSQKAARQSPSPAASSADRASVSPRRGSDLPPRTSQSVPSRSIATAAAELYHT